MRRIDQLEERVMGLIETLQWGSPDDTAERARFCNHDDQGKLSGRSGSAGQD